MLEHSTPIPVSVLIVDDNPVKLTALAAALEGMDIEIVTATSGTEALGKLLAQDFAAVLLDVNMPIMDGFETAEMIRSRPKSEHLPILFITAERLSDDARLQGYELGAVDYILSPVLPQILRSKVAVFADLYRLREQIERQSLLIANHNRLLEKQVEMRTTDLRASEARYRRITEGLTDYQYTVRIENGRAMETTHSPACATVTGYTAEEFAANPHLWIQMVVPEDRDLVREHVRQILAGKEVAPIEHRIIRKDGATRWIIDTTFLFRNASEKLLSYDGVIKDITERKQAEIAIQHANRALATLSAVNHTLVRATDENELMQAICQAIVEQKGYRMTWVGYKQYDEIKSIKIMAHAGQEEGYLEAMQPTWAETERGMSPCGCAIRSGATQVCQDIAHDSQYLPWRDAALQRGYAANIALPLTYRNGKVFGTLAVYSNEVNAFSTAEIALLEEMAGDLAFGVSSLHVRQERDLAMEQSQRHLEKLQNSLEETIRAMASLVEMRDPYTAGHQNKVADLAAAIAKQLGLPEEQVHAIHLAGVVHDLGKIKIPAEILSKPGRITDIEFSLIKVHPQAGYDILKGIAFPWPIAQMVLQHHERLDGSGYPQGLKGEAILLEARILSVADVVEAMSSHRPYRPGLGIDVALAEITKQRGTHYDPQVVDACVAVFREQSYAFKS